MRAQKAREIVVGGAAGHKAFLDIVIPKFEKQYGCKIIYEGTRSLVNLEKMVNNKSKPYLSVVLMDDPVMINAIKEDVIEKIAPSRVPNMGKLSAGTIHQDGFWVNYVQTTTGVAVNTGKVKALPSYANLWDAQYKGKLVIPSLQNTEGLALLMIAAALETGKPMKEAQYQIDAAFKKLKALKPNLLTIYTQIPQALNLLEQGEAWMIPGMIAYNAMERKAKGAPVDVLLPKEGAMAMPSGIAKVKNGPDPELSHAFINDIIGVYQKDIAELDDRGQHQDRDGVVAEEPVQQIHHVEQRLAHQFPKTKVHDLGFVMRQLRETMVEFRADVELELHGRSLAGRHGESGHAHRAFDPILGLAGFGLARLETLRPHPCRFGPERRDQSHEKLVA